MASASAETFKGLRPIAQGALGWALVLAGASFTLVLAVRGSVVAVPIGAGSFLVGWVAWRLTTSKVSIDGRGAAVVIRQPWRTTSVPLADIEVARVTAPRLAIGTTFSYPHQFITEFVLELRDGTQLYAYALRRSGFKQPSEYLGDPENARAAAAVNSLLHAGRPSGSQK